MLVIEDDALLGPLIAQMLESVGYTVTLTSDGDDAIAAVRAERFDLALADLVLLGGEDGHEVARRLGGIQPDLRVIVMSGYGVSRYGPNHNDPILSKPFTVGQLVERIELVLAD